MEKIGLIKIEVIVEGSSEFDIKSTFEFQEIYFLNHIYQNIQNTRFTNGIRKLISIVKKLQRLERITIAVSYKTEIETNVVEYLRQSRYVIREIPKIGIWHKNDNSFDFEPTAQTPEIYLKKMSEIANIKAFEEYLKRFFE